MKRFVEENIRAQGFLLPESIDEYVGADNPVRVIEAFVEELDLFKLGFEGVEPEATGRPRYHPSTMLKIYLYGYLNRIQSSRRLEREARSNLELMWLVGRLAPDFKTIANFRKDNGEAIRGVCREFICLCRRLDLFTQSIVAIDGSKFKAVNSRDRNFTVTKMKLRLEQIEESVARYLSQLDTADLQESAGAKARVVRLKGKLDKLKEEMRRLRKLEARMLESPDQQISLTDPDARAMTSGGKATGMVGYNVQVAVDAEHHLIVDHEVTNVGNDYGQLADMAVRARQASGIEDLEVLADRGYFSGPQILACEQAGVVSYLPKRYTSGSKADGLFGKQDFVYLSKKDQYRCPAGQRLTRQYRRVEDGMTLHIYRTTMCPSCPLKSQCTTGSERRVKRWEHEAVVDALRERMDRNPEKMQTRRNTVEHPFGTLKAWMGATHFLTKTLPKVRTEMSLHVLAYNMKRMMKILTPEGLLDVMQA
jgi:transposase